MAVNGLSAKATKDIIGSSEKMNLHIKHVHPSKHTRPS